MHELYQKKRYLTNLLILCFNLLMAKNKKNSLYSSFGFRLLLLTTVVALSLLGVKNVVTGYGNNNVLGTTTFLTDKGSDSSGPSSGNEVKVEDENRDTLKPTEVENKDEDENEVEKIEPTETPEQEVHTSQFSLNNLKELQVRTEENKTKIKLDSRGGSFELENEDGKLKIKAKNENGTEFELESETLDDINDALKDEGISVASSSGNTLRIRRGQFEAETHFPLSINPTTNTLTVTTPAGVKDVAVLPDQAVKNLLRNKLIDRIASGSASENPTGIRLGILGNSPVFQVLGSDDQKLFGFIPVSIEKTSFVSAENGGVIKVDETFINKLLDLLSIQ